MALRDTVKIARETEAAYKSALGKKKNPTKAEKKAARDSARALMEEKYGGTIDWAFILKIVMAILAALAA